MMPLVNTDLSAARLAPLCADAELWADPLNTAMERFEIIGAQRQAMFLAVCAYESGRFVRLQENLNYSAQGLLRTWPSRFTPQQAADYAADPVRIANHVYADRMGNGDEASGDGWRYRGRGPIQITFAYNYARAGRELGLPLLLEPGRLTEPSGGALSAAWFWADAECNDVADEGDFAGVCGLINRGDRHKAALNLADRFQWLAKAQTTLGS